MAANGVLILLERFRASVRLDNILQPAIEKLVQGLLFGNQIAQENQIATGRKMRVDTTVRSSGTFSPPMRVNSR